MASTPGRRSRDSESDDDIEPSREGTPASTAPNDRKRARRSGAEQRTPSTQSTQLPNGSQDPTRERGNRMSLLTNDIHNRRSKHLPGAIVRVKLTNFITYTSAEFFPGPGLNMVIGPNGTGKSSLVCAICLGLGYSPSVLGRAKEPSEFVKYGCREATIEIELRKSSTGQHRSKQNPVITRTIRRDGNKSSYTLKGRTTTQKQVHELCKLFNIQIDNLCQFLPQDKVVEFAAMTPIELLKSTQQAAAEPEMLQWHEELKELRKDQAKHQQSHHNNNEQLSNLKGRQEANRVHVERMREKVQTEKHMKWLEQCRPIGKVPAAREAAQEAKAAQRQLKQELEELKAEAEPTLRRSDAKQTYVNQVKAYKTHCDQGVTDAKKACSDIKTEDETLKKQHEEKELLIETELRSKQRKKQELIRAQRTVTDLRQKSAEPPPESDVEFLNTRSRNIKNRERQIDEENARLSDSQAAVRRQQTDRRAKSETLKKELKDLDTKEGQQLNKLAKLFPDTHKAWVWIVENKTKFEKDVFGPPLISCSLKDLSLADKLESLLRPTDFKMITFQTQKDFETMRRQTKLLNIHDVSLRVRSSGSLEEFRPPLQDEQLQRLGFDCWALDNLEGPPNVLAMLCDRNLHGAAISRKAIDDQQYQAITRSGLSAFVAGTTSYQITRRREYGSAGESTRTTEVQPARIWNDAPGDFGGEKASISRELAELHSDFLEAKQQMEEYSKEIRTLTDEKQKLAAESKRLAEEKKTTQDAMTQYNSLPTRLKDAEERQTRAEDDLTSVKDRVATLQQELDAALLRRADVALRYVTACEDLKEAMEKVLQAELWRIEAQSDLETMKARHEDITQRLATKTAEEMTAVQVAETKAEEAKAQIAAVRDLIKKAEKLRDESNESGLHEVVSKLITDKVGLADIEALIESDRARLDLIHGLDDNIVQEFENRAKKISELESALSTTNSELEEIRTEITTVREQWEPRLEELVGRISEKFGESFARVGCAGQVTVFKASSRTDADEEDENNQEDGGTGNTGDGLNFEKWAIHISVKFRANEPLSLLNAQRQSGGERAVSTIFYLMALQSLSRAPFRVVDEINQGMDPRNERMVHGRMVDMCSPADDIGDYDNGERKGSQYFLITPKLLSGLKYKRGMTVLCIASGEHMPAAVEGDEDGTEIETGAVDENTGEPAMKQVWRLDLKRFIERARGLNIKSEAPGRRIDSRGGVTVRQRELADSFGAGRSVTVNGDSFADDDDAGDSERFTPSQTLSVGA